MLLYWSVADNAARAVGVLDPVPFVMFVAPTHDLRCAGMELIPFFWYWSGPDVERLFIYKQSLIEYS